MDELLRTVGHLLLLLFEVVRVSPSLRLGPRIGLLANEFVHFLDEVFDARLLPLNLVLAVFTHQQIEHRLHLLEHVLLPLDRIAELVVLEQFGQRLKLLRNAALFALANRADQQVGSLRIGLAQILRQLLKRVLKPQVSCANRLLCRGQRQGSLRCRSGRCTGRGLRQSHSTAEPNGNHRETRQQRSNIETASRH